MRQPANAFCNGADQEPSHATATVRRHDDQVGFEPLGEGRNLLTGIAEGDVEVGFVEGTCRESLSEGPRGIPRAGFVVDHVPNHSRIGGGDRRQNVDQMEILERISEESGLQEELLENLEENETNRAADWLESLFGSQTISKAQFAHRLVQTLSGLSARGHCVVC
jgi:hypothetical protein